MASPSTEPPIQPFTVIEAWRFEAITPSQFITFTMQNPLENRWFLHRLVLRFAVLDSPNANADDESPVIGAMIVPTNRETDWNFCTEPGHYQLLLRNPNVSRLILIGNNPPTDPKLGIYKRPFAFNTMEAEKLVNELKPLLLSFHPKVNFINGMPETIFFSYEDDVEYRVTVATLTGRIVGDFMIEDIELRGGDDRNKQLRRRLRFKRMPRLIQSEAILLPIIPYDEGTTQTDLESLRKIEDSKFDADTSILVYQYLVHMVSGLFLIASHLNQRFNPRVSSYPTALCLGIGGGVLLSFLYTELVIKVTGVEADEAVVNAASTHFGLTKSGAIELIVGDAIETIHNFTLQKPEVDKDDSEVDKDVYDPGPVFDAIFVDLDSSEAEKGFSAPPPEFVKKPVLEDLKKILDDNGVLIMNVVPLNEEFYSTLVKDLKEIFHKVYAIDVGDQASFVVIATVSETSSNFNDDDNGYLKRLKAGIPDTDMESMVEL